MSKVIQIKNAVYTELKTMKGENSFSSVLEQLLKQYHAPAGNPTKNTTADAAHRPEITIGDGDE